VIPHAATVCPRFRYHAYGVVVSSDVPLALPDHTDETLASVECRGAHEETFVEARKHAVCQDAFHKFAFLADGSTYLGWDTVGEFTVSADGRSISCRRAVSATWESFQVYMLGQALSLALVKQGIEPLHATTVVVDGQAIAFLGDSGHGKSSLAACFLAGGHRLLTDDLLVLEESGGYLVAHPGPPRIKLFPAVARRFLQSRDTPTLNGATDKLIVPLAEHQHWSVPVPLTAIYAVTAPVDACRRRDIGIEPLSPREAFVRLLRATFNRRIVSQARLARQFAALTTIANRITVRRLSYPRSIDRLSEVRDTIIAENGGDKSTPRLIKNRTEALTVGELSVRYARRSTS
jgi:hypothetical protein